MRVLFIAKADLPDFQSDMVFHGLRSLLGPDCEDSNEMWYMYGDTKELHWNSRVPENGKSYGRGFTLYGLLENIAIDRSRIGEKIQNKYYDKIVYGSVTRCSDYFDLVTSLYSPNDVIFINGEDNTDVQLELTSKGICYKRELIYNTSDRLRPINFCIPKDLILTDVPAKIKDYGHIIPGDLSTYIYDNQQDYYKDYQDAYYGVTFKKGGWDCLRHYEILMNGCIPYFPNLDQCPQNTMTLFPKKFIVDNNKALLDTGLTNDYYDQMSFLLDYTRKYLTTEYTAKTILYETN